MNPIQMTASLHSCQPSRDLASEGDKTPSLAGAWSQQAPAELNKLAAGVAALGTAGTIVSAAALPAVRPDELIADLSSTNELTSATACDAAPGYGAAAIRPLAVTMADRNFEVARRCKRALARIVRHAGRPGASAEAVAVEAKLAELISEGGPAVQVRRDLLWMLSEIGSARAVPAIAALLTDQELREDARCVLTRLPFPNATAALRKAFKTAPEDFKFALADSLRVRGDKVEGYPSKKLVATGRTAVAPKK